MLRASTQAVQIYCVLLSEEHYVSAGKQLAVIQFLTAADVHPLKTHRQMEGVCGEKCADIITVRFWARQCSQISWTLKVWFIQKSCLLAKPLTLNGVVKHREGSKLDSEEFIPR